MFGIWNFEIRFLAKFSIIKKKKWLLGSLVQFWVLGQFPDWIVCLVPWVGFRV
jgi:hypothetical protein